MFLVDSILSTIQEHIKDIQSLKAEDIPMVKDMEQVLLDAIGSMSAHCSRSINNQDPPQ